MEPQTPTQPKKKSGVLGWILIGCLGLALIFGILAVSCGLFVFNKGKKVVQDFEKNPAKAAAETMVRLNPELELVDSDEDAGTMTIRNKKTGEEFTADYSDIEEGKISFESDGKAVSFDARGAAEGGSGVITMTDEAGEQTAVIGGQGDSSAVPSWFPLYPGASDVGATYSAKNATEETGLFTFSTTDSVDDVMDFYRDELGDLGFDLNENTYSSAGVQGGSLSGQDGDGRTVAVSVSEQGDSTQVGVNYTVALQ